MNHPFDKLRTSELRVPIVILHGWRVGGQRYHKLSSLLAKTGYRVLSPDMPGAANEKLKKSVMHINDYVSFILQLLMEKKIKKAIFIGHSFGGRVAAKLAANNPEIVEKLVLSGAPLIKQPLSFKKHVIVLFAKILKKGLKTSFGESRMRKVLYYLLGEWDYYKAPSEIRSTLKAIIAEDISPSLPKIKAETLVLWGQNDTFVSKKIGREIAEKIPQATYREIPKATHRLPYENPEIFAREVLDFLQQKRK